MKWSNTRSIASSHFLVIALFTLTCLGSPALAQHEGGVEADQMRYFVDENRFLQGQIDFNVLEQQPWRQVADRPLSLGFTEHPVWLHLEIRNLSDRRQRRYLAVTNPSLDEVDFYLYKNGRLVESSRMGDHLPFENRPIPSRIFLQSLQVEAGDQVDAFIRAETGSSLQIPVALWQTDRLASWTETSSLLLGIYFGTLLVMLLYNFSIYINGRDRKYLHYVIYLASIGLFFTCVNGLAYRYIWPGLPGLTDPVVITSLSSTVLFACLFACSFLGLANTRPLLDLAMRLIAFTAALLATAGLLLPYTLAIQATIFLVILASITSIICGLVRWRDEHPAAMLFLLAWFALLSGGIVMSANKIGWIARTPLTEHLVQIGSMLEFMVLSLALIKQLNTERRAKNAAQRTALAFERQASQSRQEALELQRHATEELERRVEQRTHELQALNEKLQKLSTTDSLTGLKNRRYFNERFLAEFSRSKRDNTPISVIIIDVDHFKSVNDTHGHLIGDELLTVVAQHIGAEAKRESDIIARYGGEEFSVVLIKNNPAQALDIAEKIRARVENMSCQSAGFALRCTVSIGVATLTPHRRHVAEELLRQADEALYRSKAEGRNRVSVFGQAAA